MPSSAAYQLSVEKVTWPWMGPAQNYLHWYRRLREILHEFRPDIIDLWEEPWGLVSAHACRLRNRYFPKARIISETEQNIEKKLPPPFEWCRSYVLRNADYVVGRSDEAVNVARRKGYAGPASIVPNGVDDSLFRPLDPVVCKAAAGVKGFVVGYAGRLVVEKGLTDLIQAIAACAGDVQCLIIGDGPLCGQLRKMIDEPVRLEKRVRLIPPQKLDALPSYFNAMDVLVLPSWTTARWKEQFGRVIIESQACGVPVIGSSSARSRRLSATGE